MPHIDSISPIVLSYTYDSHPTQGAQHMKHHRPIRLEDSHEPSWDDAKTRLLVACETYGFPVYIAMDDAPYAYASIEHKIEADSISKFDMPYLAQWWDEHVIRINDYEEGLRALYPWFHGGEDMPK